MAALETLKGILPETTFYNLDDEIKDLQKKYEGNAADWNKDQLTHAKESMLAEATRRVGVIDTKNVIKNDVYKEGDTYKTEVVKPSTNVTSFEEDT